MKPNRPKKEQPRAEDVQGAIERFIQTHFYQGQAVTYAKHRPDLLKWVVWKLATYLDNKGVTIPGDRYVEIMLVKPGILMDALRFCRAEKINYLPAYLLQCVQSHLAIHGEDYYEEGKALRNHLQSALMLARKGIQGRDPVRELAAASRLLKLAKKRVNKPAKNRQLTLI